MASAIALRSVGSKKSPAGPTTSGSEPAALARTGVPQAIASTGGRPKPSSKEGCTSAIARP